jgi:predicted porin
MHRKLIAAAAALACASSFAQSSVTLYGVMDIGFTHASGDLANWSGLASNRNMSSRIGFRGAEDLGGGLKASFVLEADLLSDSGSGVTTPLAGWSSIDNRSGAASGGLQFNRISTVGLSGAFGEVTFGRYYTPTFLVEATYDPFGQNGVGISLLTGTSVFYTPVGSVNHLRASNMILYTSPNFAGFTGMAAYARSEAAANQSKDGEHKGFKLGYAKGPLSVDVAAGRTTLAAVGDLKTITLGGSWDFGVIRPMFHASEDQQGGPGANGRKRGLLVGAHIPVGAGQVRVAIARVHKDSDTTTEGRVRQLSIGYVHNLSKRTAVFATFTSVRNSNYVNAGTAGYSVGNAVVSPNGSVRAQDIGIRHVF